MVTANGHWLGSGWHRRRSEADAAAGIIARQAQLDGLSADLERGVLTLRLPKAEAKKPEAKKPDEKKPDEAKKPDEKK